MTEHDASYEPTGSTVVFERFVEPIYFDTPDGRCRGLYKFATEAGLFVKVCRPDGHEYVHRLDAVTLVPSIYMNKGGA